MHGMKLQEALRKVIRQFGGSVMQEKRLMSFLADYKAFDDYPAVKEVMKAIATGDYGKRLCLAADENDADYLRFADELRESLVRDCGFRQEFADYAVDSISFALGIGSTVTVTEPGDHGFEASQKNAGGACSSGSQGSGNTQSSTAGRQAPSQRRRGSSGGILDSVPNGADSHRRFYRGEDITDAFDDGSFSASVADGSFRDIFPGDYIMRKVTVPAVADKENSTYDVKFVIADLDTAMNQGLPKVAAHHAVIVPEKPVFSAYMNPTDTNAGGYAGSYMHGTVLPYFALGLIGAFGENHLLRCSFDGSDRAAADPLSCTCRLMTLSMVSGQTPRWWGGGSWSDFKKDCCLGGVQLAAFRLRPDIQGNGMWYWLSDVTSPSSLNFANVYGCGGDGVYSGFHNASYTGGGVRPFALLV